MKRKPLVSKHTMSSWVRLEHCPDFRLLAAWTQRCPDYLVPAVGWLMRQRVRLLPFF